MQLMFLEVLKHDGPTRLGRLKHEDQNLRIDIRTPNFFSISTDEAPEHEVYLSSSSTAIKKDNILIDYGSLFEEKNMSRFGILPDMRVGLKAPKELAEQAVERTVEFARMYPGYGAVVQGGGYVELRRRCAEALSDRPLLAIADGGELLDNQRLLVDIVTSIREVASPNTALYYPFAPPHAFYLLAYMGMDMFDTGTCLLNARKGIISTNRGEFRLDEIDELPCSCGICKDKNPDDLIQDKSLALSHNFNVALGVVREIRVAIRAGSYRELVEEKSSSSPRMMAALRLLDREKQDFLEKYTPTAP